MSANLELDLTRKFRKMISEDVSEILNIEKRIYTHPWTEGIFNDCIRVGYNCWVYIEAETIVAYGLVSIAANEAHILNLCVAPESQGQGLGKLMLFKLIQLAEDRLSDSIFLEVRESNLVALNLYEQEGFNRIGLRKNYYPSEDGKEDALVFAKALNIDKSVKGSDDVEGE